jgi:CBS domain-containing protein
VTDDEAQDAGARRAAARRHTSDVVGPEEFLRSLPPFDRLDEATFRDAAATLEVVYLPAGTRALHRGGAPSEHLQVVRKGIALLLHDGVSVASVEPGEWFGFPSVVRRLPPEFDVDAVDDLLVYRLPGETVRNLARTPAFADEVAGLASRLRALTAESEDPGPRVPMAPVTTLVARDLVTLPADADVGRIARTMRDEGVSSVVLRGDPPAIVTTRDLRDRVLADGRGPSTPGAEVASRPILSVDVATSVVEARVRMLERSMHHLGVERDGELIAVITTGDLLREDASSPFHVQRELATAPRGAGAQVPERLHATVAGLLRGGLSPLEVTRTVSMLTDVLLRRAIELAVADLGPPPTDFAWLTLGSDGRREQTLLTDQDHALVHEEVDEHGARWFEQMATDVTDQLAAAGLPYCPGGVMATNWSGTVATWRTRFERWFAEPDVQALLETGIFLDRRVVAGGLDVHALDQVVAAHRTDGVLLARMAAGAGAFRPPLGVLHRVRGASDGTVDLKHGGINPIVALARVLAVEAGSAARSTIDRLEAAAAHGTLSQDAADELTEAFGFLQALRIRAHLRAWSSSTPATNLVHLAELTPTKRRNLKDAFVAVARIQRSTIRRLGGEDVAR